MIRILAIAVLIIIVLGALVAHQQNRIDTLSIERSQAITFANSEKMVAAQYKNKWGRETAKAQQLELTLNNAREFINNDRLAWVKQFNGINKKLNNLEQATQTTLDVVNEWHLPLRDTLIVNIDSTIFRGKVFSYRDSLNQITGLIKGDTIIPKISITVPLQGVVYWNRNKIMGLRIGRKQWYSDITSSNPFVKIQSHEAIKITKR